jgi:RNA polymerase sigma-70 factor (ECF subfamily)
MGDDRLMSDPVHIDLALTRQILGGDERAFRQLFDAFFPRLYRFALVRLRGDHDGANEVVQLTFCKAIERLDTYRGEAALYTWFCQICRNTLIDHCRSRSADARHLVPLEDQPDLRAVLDAITAPAIERPEVAVWQDDVRRLIQATMDVLPDHYGDVLEWKYVDGLPVQEIARRLAIGPKAAESLLTRAREAFRAAMLEMAVTPDALRPPQPG